MQNKTPFLQARIKQADCNMILCEWGNSYSEWIFKGSPQIMKLFSKFDQTFLDVNRSRMRHNPNFMKRMAQFNMPRQLKNRVNQSNIQAVGVIFFQLLRLSFILNRLNQKFLLV